MTSTTCRFCHRPIRLRATDDADTRKAVVFNHEGACRNRLEAARRDALEAQRREAGRLARETADNALSGSKNLLPYQWQGETDLTRSHHASEESRTYSSLHPIREGREIAMPTPKPVPAVPVAPHAPVTWLCRGESILCAKPVPYSECQRPGSHARIRSDEWEARQGDDGMGRDYRMTVNSHENLGQQPHRASGDRPKHPWA